jgi:tRNA (5-methylaminomethyl-2-thiouridylate)-methyltransferase
MFAVLLSGGVDSSVALGLLREETSESITAYYLKVWLEDELSYLGNCPWEEDLGYAEAVAGAFGVPLRVVSLQREYHEKVVSYVLEELRLGRTPSPDLFCNADIKFKAFVEALPAEAASEGSGLRIATGHYARVEQTDGPKLFRAPDPVKDQTYFLSRLSPEQLSGAHFPLGHLTKEEVRERARRWNLPNRDRPDSQGICFLGKIRYRDFVGHHLGEKTGPIVDIATGNILGSHRGHWFYTPGQRQGLGLGGGPWYVIAKDVVENRVLVAHAESEEERRTRRFAVRGINRLGTGLELLDGSRDVELQFKVRHGPGFLSGRLGVDGRDPTRGTVELATPERGIADGQFAVFYLGDECIGSGIIQRIDETLYL